MECIKVGKEERYIKDFLDLAKKLCEDLGGDGGYLMTQTKIGTFRADGKRENVLAVSEFVQNYRC